MALNDAQLAADLQAIFNAGHTSAQAAGDDWGDAIDAYALTGAANGVPPVTAAAISALRAAFGAQFAVVPGSAAGAASGIRTTLDAFWAACTFAGAAGPPVPGGGAALQTALTGIFNVAGGTAASKAGEIRDAIRTYTNLVIVTFPPGNPFPVI